MAEPTPQTAPARDKSDLEIFGSTLANLGQLAATFQDRLTGHIKAAELVCEGVVDHFDHVITAADSFRETLKQLEQDVAQSIQSHEKYVESLFTARAGVIESFGRHTARIAEMTGVNLAAVPPSEQK